MATFSYEAIYVGSSGARGPSTGDTPLPGTIDESAAFLLASDFLSIVYGTPVVTAGRIEIPASLIDGNGNPIVVENVMARILVSDAANSFEPSDTTTVASALVPSGTLLSGLGTATSVWATGATGVFKIALLDSISGARYLFTNTGGHARRYVRAQSNVLTINFP